MGEGSEGKRRSGNEGGEGREVELTVVIVGSCISQSSHALHHAFGITHPFQNSSGIMSISSMYCAFLQVFDVLDSLFTKV